MSNQVFLEAAKIGNVNAVLAWLARGVNIHVRDKDGRTALHLAAEYNHVNVAKILLEHGASIDLPMPDGGTPLFDAVAMGHDAMVHLLLDNGANFTLTDDRDWNLLHWVASENRITTARLLIHRCPSLLNKTKFNGISSVYLAAHYGHPEMVQTLIALGADFRKADTDGKTPFDVAYENNYLALANYLYSLMPPLSQIAIDQRIKNINNEVKSDEHYYGISNEVPPFELAKEKWKTYIYLRKCVLQYRNALYLELFQVIGFLETSVANKEWLSKKLMDRAEKTSFEAWGSGSHEWLERTLIVDVLRRSAGMIDGVQAETEFKGERPDIDWIYVQAQLRSRTKYLFFRLPNGSIKEGHAGAVKPNLSKPGFSSKGSPAFHKKLEKAFYESTTLAGFIIRVHNIFKHDAISGKKSLLPDDEKRYVVDGTQTNHAERINKFRREKLRIHGYNPTVLLMKNMMHLAAEHRSLDEYSASPTDSESSDDEYSVSARSRLSY